MISNAPHGGAAALYVHIPFCAAKCHYCDFVSYVSGENSDTQESEAVNLYLAALLKEAGFHQAKVSPTGAVIKSLYLGGGTPTRLTARQLFMLLEYLQQVFALSGQAEITVEGNPGTINKEKLEALQIQGCNRLSLGVQSFEDRELQALGRIHTVQDVYNTYNLAQEAGFANINLDLMYGLPGQELSGWRKNLRTAVSLNPEHISLYQLNIEKGTPFFSLQNKGLLAEFEQDEAFYMYEEAINYLTDSGYCHYEISNFAKPAYESRHNQVYWRNQEYIGIGAGASGYLAGRRYTNLAVLADYEAMLTQGARPLAQEETIDTELAMTETMFLGLRLLEGVDKNEFFLHFGIQINEHYGKAIDKLTEQGLIEETQNRVRLTRQGLYIANQVMMEFLR